MGRNEVFNSAPKKHMKGNNMTKKTIKRFTAFSIALAMVFTMFAGNIGLETVYADDQNGDGVQYKLEDTNYGNRLRNHFGEMELEIDFELYDEEGNKLFDQQVADQFNQNAKIQINDGDVKTFAEAGLENDTAWDGPVYQVWVSTDKDFIKSFAKEDTLNIKIWDYNDNLIEGTLQNQLTDEDIEELFKDDDDDDDDDDQDENGTYIINDNSYMTRLKNDGWDDVEPKFELSFETRDEDDNVIYKEADATRLSERGYIRVNGGAKLSFSEAGLANTTAWNGTVIESWSSTSTDFIKTFIAEDEISVEIFVDDEVVAQGSIPNQIDEADRAKFLEENGDDTGSGEAEQFYRVKVAVMHSANGDESYVYTDKSMAADVLLEDAEILETEDGNKLILHYNVAEIMGAVAYCTDFKLTTEPFAVMAEGEEGDIATEFIMYGNNDAVEIVDLPAIEESIFEGYIYSNIMGNPAALRISDISDPVSVEGELEELVTKAKSDTAGKEYYDIEPFNAALNAAETATDKYAEKYVNLVRETANLREKLDNPFADGNLFFVPVTATSAFANPPGTTKKILKPWGRVTIEDGKTILKVEYGIYFDFRGKAAVQDVTVFDTDGVTPLPVEFVRNDDDTATLSFEMPFYPESGVFKTTLTDLEGNVYESDLILDYAHIHKGMMPKLLQEEIQSIDWFQKDWVGPFDGRVSVDRKDYYTEASFEKYLNVLNRCEEDLKPENRKNLTQDIIDKDIQDLRDAYKQLIFRAAAGEGSNINNGADTIGNPGNINEDDTYHIFEAPWVGTRIYFGGHVYKVLNNGMRYNTESEESEETGKILIMADDFTVNQPWFNENPDDTADVSALRWDKSDLRKYLNEDFYNGLNSFERGIVLPTLLKTQDTSGGWFSGISIDDSSPVVETTDNVFLLDALEMKSAEYGFVSPEARKTGEFYFVRNLYKGTWDVTYKLLGIKPKGNLESFNQDFDLSTHVYPVMNLDKSKVMMTLQADREIPEGIEPVERTESNIWKLVVQDPSKNLEVEDVVGDLISFNADAANGDIYAVVVEGEDYTTGTIKSFGRVGDAQSGEVRINIPENFNETTDKIYLVQMSEVNSMYISSEMQEVEIDEEDLLRIAKDQKLAEIDNIQLSDSDKEGKTPESIAAAEQKLEELKNEAREAVENATTIAEVNQVTVDIEQAKALLKEDTSLADGQYTVDVYMFKQNKDSLSMSNDMFTEKADITVSGDKVELKLYVAYPIPAFPTLGQDGTLSDVKVMYGGQTYEATYDITTKPLKPARSTNLGFGLVKGEMIPMQVITISDLPKEILLEDRVPLSAYVNVVMNTNVKFDMVFSNLKLVGNDPNEPETQVYEVVEGDNQTVDISDGNDAKFRINADYSKFQNGGKVFVDGQLLDPQNYDSEEGSTIISLKASYLKTLSNGEHILKVIFNDGGEATAKFKIMNSTKNASASGNTVNKASNNSPMTGDDANVVLWILLAAIATVSVVAIKRKRNQNR